MGVEFLEKSDQLWFAELKDCYCDECRAVLDEIVEFFDMACAIIEGGVLELLLLQHRAF